MKKKYSLLTIFKHNKLKISFTFLLLMLEIVSAILFPLFMGYAINDLMEKSYDNLMVLVVLVVFSVIVGVMRRFYDSRIYGGIYVKVATDLTYDENRKGSSVSQISARVDLLYELVEFFENAMPEIVNNVLGLAIVLGIIALIDTRIALLCGIVIVAVFIVYGVTSKYTIDLNKDFNDELETLVHKLEKRDVPLITKYFNKINGINIKLSDVEALNFGLIICIAMIVFIYSMTYVTQGEGIVYGTVFSVLMYIFEFIERITVLPLYYQHYLRLHEISERLNEPDNVVKLREDYVNEK